MKKSICAKKIICDKKQIAGKIDKIADAIIKDFPGASIRKVGFLGIQTKGIPLAEKIGDAIKRKTGHKVSVGSIDISMYRDDIGIRRKLSSLHETSIPFDLEDEGIILVDDVLHTGRTIRAALDAVTDYGRPSFIRLAVLIDRGGREFPIQPDYVGEKYKADDGDKIIVKWDELDGVESALLIRNKSLKK